MWEITGKGLAKPSYLFGTMHVSNKMVFHLSDSFYLAIKNADVVAVETNPATWQDDFSRYELDGPGYYSSYRQRGNFSEPKDFLSINTLKAFPYEKLFGPALSSNPSMINSFLYRNNANGGADFEEDTYLDLYIYQVGKKWGKKLCGVEDFDESMTLMREAYADAAKDKKAERRNYDVDAEFSYAKMEEAYRTGNLDLLDTINKANSRSEAFDEKFLYKRNEIQAHSIDLIIKSKSSLFVGVGAAHLPGERGVIEMLRSKGYKLRPIKMTERDSRHKDEIEAIRVPVQFSTQVADDGMFSVRTPGKLYSFSQGFGLMEQQQYADMSNGSYYMVARITTNAGVWGHTTAMVQKKIDSVLYENIPGKILSRQAIIKNGYNGFDIVNKTRRGDYQRYNIFTTPFEVIVFKVSGNGEYVRQGKEAEEFFSSVQLKSFGGEIKNYSPAFGGFEVKMPEPFVTKHLGNYKFMAYEKTTATNYLIIRTDVHNMSFAEEDSFDLNLMEESFASSDFIDKLISRKQTKHQGYAALDAKYQYKDGSAALVKFVIQGPHYYTVVANAAKENKGMQQFLQSFTLKPFIYNAATQQTDTALLYTVQSPVNVYKKKKLLMYPEDMNRFGGSSEEDAALTESGVFRDKVIEHDSTGEKIYLSFYKPGRYYFDNDSTVMKDTSVFNTHDQKWIYRSRKKYESPNKTKVFIYELGDPLSSRMVKGKVFIKNGVNHRLEVFGDTLTKESDFVTSFFSSFQPSDTITGVDERVKKTTIYFSDFFSADTLLHKRAIKNVAEVKFDSSDFVQLKKVITKLTWTEKKYLDVKKDFIRTLADVKTKQSSDFLKQLYYAAEDTVELQYTILETLLRQQNNYSYAVFRNIMIDEPPVLSIKSTTNRFTAPVIYDRGGANDYDDDYSNGQFLDELTDSVQLTATIFKDLLPLININDYEQPMLNLLETMVDSNLVSDKDYEMYLPKLLLEAKQEMKKQVINEKNKSIEKAQEDEDEKESRYNQSAPRDNGNARLSSYATLLMPFYPSNPAVPQLLQQMLRSNDNRLKYNTALLLLEKNKPLPDTLLPYFSKMDDYRNELYVALKKRKLLQHFPAAANNHIDLARSELLTLTMYNAPDTAVYLSRMPVQTKNRNGFVYFFKYRNKKEENGWRIGMVGLVPANAKEYLFENEGGYREEFSYNFTELTGTKIDSDEPMEQQLKKVLKKKLFSKRKSAASFYEGDDRNNPVNILYNFRD